MVSGCGLVGSDVMPSPPPLLPPFPPQRLGELKMMAGRIFEMRDKLKDSLVREGECNL